MQQIFHNQLPLTYGKETMRTSSAGFTPSLQVRIAHSAFRTIARSMQQIFHNQLPLTYGKETMRTSSAGFTLIEVVIVTGILAVLTGTSLLFTVDSYRGNVFRSEVAVVVNLLQKARSQAVNNVDEKPHGVYFDTANGAYVLFHGDSYDPADSENEMVAANATVSVAASSDTVVFEQLTGRVDSGMTGNVTMSYGNRVTTVNVNEEGRINW